MKTLVLGFDAFDPTVFEELSDQGKLPHLTRYAENSGYTRFAVANPPQSEVSWTSIATGLNPGGHGIFDFVHRNPRTYALSVSLLPMQRSMVGTQFVPPYTSRTIFEQAAKQGYPATALWWPATFPARPELPVRTLPGLGTPDIQGRLGVGTFFSTDASECAGERKTPVEPLGELGKQRFRGSLKGPMRKKRGETEAAELPIQIEVTGEKSARVLVDQQIVDLVQGQWSPIVQVTFKMGWFVKVRALTRILLTQTEPDVKLYFLPLQLHPLHSPWRYGTPRPFVKELWERCGPFLTLGWPQDTTALEDECIDDAHFLALCDSIFHTRERILMHLIDTFQEGIVSTVFDTMDRIQHMFWRSNPEVVEQWYQKLDDLVGRVERRLAFSGNEDTKLIIVSDHGFSDFDQKVHLNRWLVEQGYLVPKEETTGHDLNNVDWSQSKAYALGLNSLYINLAGREGQGAVQPHEYESTIHQLRTDLSHWTGPDGRPVVHHAFQRDEVFSGSLTEYGPDLVIGYSAGYRGSAQTGLGKWEAQCLETNRDHWGADHCVDPQAVPGVLFANRGLANFSHPSYKDFPALAIDSALDHTDAAPPPSVTDEGQEAVEERLKGLGYL